MRSIATKSSIPATTRQRLLANPLTGYATGLVTGLVGVSGRTISLPLQMLLLGETIKVAINNLFRFTLLLISICTLILEVSQLTVDR